MQKNKKGGMSAKAIESVLTQGQVCHIAMAQENQPYVVPFFYGYHLKTIYIHCVPDGQMMQTLKRNPCVCIEVSTNVAIDLRGGPPGVESGKYRSVIGFGVAVPIKVLKQKEAALDRIMRHYGGRFKLPAKNAAAREALQKTAVLKIKLKNISGKTAVG